MTDLYKAAPYVRLHRGKTFVLKAGGGAIARPAGMRALARQIAVVHSLGARIVVVHGGGPQTDLLQKQLGDEPRMVDGRRVTTAIALRALRMATAGELHSEILGAMRAEGAPAVGVSGTSVLTAAKRPPIPTSQGLVDFGLVGDLRGIEARPLHALLDAGCIPVISPPASDGAGGALNVNADLAAAALATALGAAKLVLLTGAPGILRSPTDPLSLVSALSLSDLDELDKAGAIQAGMRVKATAIRTALAGGVGRVHVVSGTDPDALIRELYTTHGAGTLVTREPERAPVAEPAPLGVESNGAEAAAS
ncbi:MAG: acetylglutamate kinase [Planctomycetes bacterium]|nr:acetylglutamate kinase [Planctomycetota bacterium]